MIRCLIALFILAAAPDAMAQSMWTIDTVQSLRFADDAETNGPELAAGTRVDVLFEEDSRVRVMASGKYGWVAKEALTDVAPASAAPSSGLNFDLGAGGLPPGINFNLGGAGAGK